MNRLVALLKPLGAMPSFRVRRNPSASAQDHLARAAREADVLVRRLEANAREPERARRDLVAISIGAHLLAESVLASKAALEGRSHERGVPIQDWMKDRLGATWQIARKILERGRDLARDPDWKVWQIMKPQHADPKEVQRVLGGARFQVDKAVQHVHEEYYSDIPGNLYATTEQASNLIRLYGYIALDRELSDGVTDLRALRV